MKTMSGPIRQRGIVAVMAVIFLITAVIFVLTQTLNITGTASIDNKQQLESTAALFLAESGIERSVGLLKTSGNPTDSSTCTALTGTFNLPDSAHTFNLSPNAVGCIDGFDCVSCDVTSTGIVANSASRSIKTVIKLKAANGVVCNSATTDCTNATANPPTVPPTWKMVLRNNGSLTYDAVALFSMAFLRQGNPSGAGCTSPQCVLEWNINASNGANSVGGMGNAVIIPYGGVYDIYQTLTQNKNLAEVGVLFQGSTTPFIVGSAWGDTTPSGDPKTIGKPTDSTGSVVGGTIATGSPVCTAPGPDSYQSCTNWCYGGDTLIFGFGAHSSSGLTDRLQEPSGVIFNTAGVLPQNVGLSKRVKFPDSDTPGAPNDVYTEVWSAYNPNLTPKSDVTAGSFTVGEKYVIKTLGSTDFTLIGATGTAPGTVNTSFVATGAGTGSGAARPLNPFTLNASSYKGNGAGAIGAKWTGGNTTCGGVGTGNCVTVTASNFGSSGSVNGTTLTVSGGSTPSPIYPGATITKNGTALTGSPYVTRQLTSTEAGGALAGRGTYEISISQSPNSTGNWTATNSILTVGTFVPTAVAATTLVAGNVYQIATVGNTTWTAIGAANNTVGTVFAATGPGSGSGTATPVGFPYQIITPQIRQNTLSPTITLGVGDLVTSSGGSGNISGVTVVSQLTSNETGGMTTGIGGRGTYSLISTGVSAVTADGSRSWTTSSNVLNVSACTICFFDPSTIDVVSGLITNKSISAQLVPQLAGNAGRTAEATGGVGRYVLTSSGTPALPNTVASANTLRAGTSGATIYLPSAPTSTQSWPTSSTRIAVVSGNGAFAANTVAGAAIDANAATKSFTVLPTPTTALNAAKICGGTCAFFNQTAGENTTFSINKSTAPGTDNWASGFMCVSGADQAPSIVKGTPTVIPTTWSEVVN